jgi:hypothetical protein
VFRGWRAAGRDNAVDEMTMTSPRYPSVDESFARLHRAIVSPVQKGSDGLRPANITLIAKGP